MIRLARKIHRIVSYLAFVQVTLWILGGLVFASLPFDSVVKGGSLVQEPAQAALPGNWPALQHAALGRVGPLRAVQAHPSSQGTLVALEGETNTLWLQADTGMPAVAPGAEQVARYARRLYAGSGELAATRYLADTEYRVLGLVDELYGRTGVWQVQFDDALRTRLYFEGATGRYLSVRNDAWVLYDAMWRLHIMDYRGGENFNNLPLLVFALLATLFTLSGAVLTVKALQRSAARLRPGASLPRAAAGGRR